MTNLKTIFKQKSKLLLTFLCLLGMLFSYSCSCRNRATQPPVTTDTNTSTPPPVTADTGLTGGVDNGSGGLLYTVSSTLSRNLMVVNSDGTDTTFPITVTVVNADISSFIVSGIDGLELENNNGAFKVKNGFNNIQNSETEVTLSLNYKKKAAAKEKDTISPDKEDLIIKVIKATKISLDNQVKNIFGSKGDIRAMNVDGVTFLVDSVTLEGTKFILDTVGADNTTGNDYETKKIGKEFFGSDELLKQLKKSILTGGSLVNYVSEITYNKTLPNGDAQVFYYTLTTKDDDSLEFDNKEFSVEIKNDKHSTTGRLAIEWTD
ncbi:hypothetical protein [Brachyspira catarrhinii]|uniref:Lipoprotein n=1 Tax=Brachyspira catarrhinii TaxID=2528966 RepID=A0ABY2TRD7_9SPIR|nr:hypothetical protein [Brachyspira catarrhinii]TKZ35417.1 hypothetical protein EZH24_05405 [Brachyspira catarrhinii]